MDSEKFFRMVRESKDEASARSMMDKWPYVFKTRYWSQTRGVGVKELADWMKEHLEPRGWTINSDNPTVVGIHHPNDAITFKIRWQ